MSFTGDIKKEIISLGLGGKKGGLAERKAGLSAFIRTSGALGIKDGTPSFFIVSETENVAEFFMRVFGETFGCELSVTHASMDRRTRRDKLLLQCPADHTENVLKELKLLKRSGEDFREDISETLTATERQKIAYAQGAFLGGGSCTLPSEGGGTGYHLEIVFSEKKPARAFCRLLEELEVLPKMLERKAEYVVYMKSKESISDFLSVLGVKNALRRFSEVVEKRDESNAENRAKNCMQGNADKAAKAAVSQVLAIRKLAQGGNWEDLSEELKELATTRLLNPAMSLQELADMLKISKSCLNHRMRKLMSLAEKSEEERREL